MAVRAFFSPETCVRYKTEAASAKAYGVSTALFAITKKQMGASMLEDIRTGKFPAPKPPSSEVETSVTSQVPKPSVDSTEKCDALKAQLAVKCVRLGDGAMYGKHGLKGMYREGVKWAIGAMKDGVFLIDR